jgi:cobalt-zinc-cadmium efflux system outer membrane protein
MYGPPWRGTALLVGCLVLSTQLATTILAAEPGHSMEATPATQRPGEVGAPLSLAYLEQMAAQGNPTLAQAAANVAAAAGRAVQAGLYPNPTIGYEADRIGAAGTAGELQGAFIDQTIVTVGKLRLNRAKYAQEMSQMEAQALAQQYRVLNGVRARFYQLLAMQRLLDVRGDLLKVAEDAATTTAELVNVGAANKADLLQARIEARQERVALENARALYLAAWQQLAAFVGNPCLPVGRLQGDLEDAAPVPDYDRTLTHLLDASPELQVARAEVTRNQIGLKREQVEPIPNVQVRVANGYDFDTRKDTTSVQVGVRLPLFDKNQGNIKTAQAQLAYAQAEVGRVELSLRQRLARAYASYRTAQAVVDNYRQYNLSEAKEAYELYLESFRQRRAAWPQVLVAQRTYFQISVDYTEALEEMRRAEVAILGLLLVDGLDEPSGAPGENRVPRREQQSGTGDLPDTISPRGGRSLENRLGSTNASPGG